MIDSPGRYKILGRIGTGRLGELFRARDTQAGRTVALRIVADEIAQQQEVRQRLVHDARAAALVSHHNIAALYEIVEERGQLFLVSEFVPGDTLQTVISGRPLNPRHAVDYAIQVADALAVAHADGLAHGDIRTSQIIITPKGIAKLIDFGLVRSVLDADGRTPRNGEADLLSLGAVLFEMLAGSSPLAPPDARADVSRRAKARMPAALDAIVAKMLAKDGARRFLEAASVAAELRGVAATIDGMAGPGGIPSAAPHRRTGLWMVIAVVTAAIVAALIFFPW